MLMSPDSTPITSANMVGPRKARKFMIKSSAANLSGEALLPARSVMRLLRRLNTEAQCTESFLKNGLKIIFFL